MKRKDFSLSKFRSDHKLYEDRSYICFDDKTWNLFEDFFLNLIENSKDFGFDIKNATKQLRNKEISNKDYLDKIRSVIFKYPEILDKSQNANLLVVFDCISDHWNIFPKEK